MSNRESFDRPSPEEPQWLTSARPADASALQASVFYRAGELAGYESGLQAARRERQVPASRRGVWAAAGLLLAAGTGFGLFQLGTHHGQRLAMARLQTPSVYQQPASALDQQTVARDAITTHADAHVDMIVDRGAAEAVESMGRGNPALASDWAIAPVPPQNVQPAWVRLWWQHYVQPAINKRQETVAWVSTRSSWESMDADLRNRDWPEDSSPSSGDGTTSDTTRSQVNELPIQSELLEFQPANPLKTLMNKWF